MSIWKSSTHGWQASKAMIGEEMAKGENIFIKGERSEDKDRALGTSNVERSGSIRMNQKNDWERVAQEVGGILRVC